jgi:hypothetical protein
MYFVSASDIHIDDLHRKTRRYNSIMAYAESKLANVMFSAELARRLEGNFIINASFSKVDILCKTIVLYMCNITVCYYYAEYTQYKPYTVWRIPLAYLCFIRLHTP